jgi:hypothetical protein
MFTATFFRLVLVFVFGILQVPVSKSYCPRSQMMDRTGNTLPRTTTVCRRYTELSSPFDALLRPLPLTHCLALSLTHSLTCSSMSCRPYPSLSAFSCSRGRGSHQSGCESECWCRHGSKFRCRCEDVGCGGVMGDTGVGTGSGVGSRGGAGVGVSAGVRVGAREGVLVLLSLSIPGAAVLVTTRCG